MYPVILRLGPVTIYSYGLMMAIAFLVSGYLVGKELERKGFNGEIASSILFSAAVGGIVGSRILSILNDWPEFVRDPVQAVFSGAGFVWFGGLIGGFITVSLTIRRHGLPWLTTVDSIGPVLALGHAIGRIGCELAGDGDWGRETTLPWGMSYPNAIVGWHYPPGVRVHPTPIYEAIVYTAIFALLWSTRRRPNPAGRVFCRYLILTALARFLVEFVRINPAIAFGLTEAQWISIALALVGVGGLVTIRVAETHRPSPAAASGR